MVRVGEEIKESEGVKRKGRGYIRCGRCRLHQLHHYLLLFSDPLWDFRSLFLADFLMFFWDLISFDTWGFFSCSRGISNRRTRFYRIYSLDLF